MRERRAVFERETGILRECRGEEKTEASTSRLPGRCLLASWEEEERVSRRLEKEKGSRTVLTERSFVRTKAAKLRT